VSSKIFIRQCTQVLKGRNILILVENDSKEAAYHFSVEELFMRYIRKDESVLMLWQADKTVMLGNNQVAEAEVDLEYALTSAIQVVRRSSGGGAIYTDLGTVLYTVIEPLTSDAAVHRERVAATVINALGKMGVSAVREGRNDILIDGRKVSGFAQYTCANHVCTHGSLLYDTDLDTMTDVLIANPAKLQPKGIASIRSRVTNIKPHMRDNYTTKEFLELLKSELLGSRDYSTYQPGSMENEIITRIYNEKYANTEWNFRM
jgi:lipoate-protein ligase A